MTSVLEIAAEVLGEASYQTWTTSLGTRSGLGFEDANILGVAFEFDTVEGLIEGWRDAEEAMLARFGNSFRQAGEKAWNVYCVLLTHEAATEGQARAIRSLEEDLEQTRKLAGHSLASRERVRSSLLPILPLASKPELSTIDASKRLSVRIENLAPGISNLVLDENSTPHQILAQLGARQ